MYGQMWRRFGEGKTVQAGVIGTGQYATAVVTQSLAIPLLDVHAVADLDVAAALRAYQEAGLGTDEIAICDGRPSALAALERGQRVVVEDALLLMGLPLDIIVEATGEPEAGAIHASEAISHGKHVAMVNKETDVTVGPILKRLADRAGLVYTAVDGDQHGLLIGLVAWARDLGLEVLCAGKARNAEFVYDADAKTVTGGQKIVALGEDSAECMQTIPPGRAHAFVQARSGLLAALGRIGGYDVVELAIAANATGLLPDVESMHCPALRTVEIAEALCPVAEGGILERRGAIEGVTCLRSPDGPGLGGGVFAVVSCANDYSRGILTSKGLHANARDSAALIYRPSHLCGVETATSILSAVLLGLPTGASDYLPLVDVVARAARDLAAGERIGSDHDPAIQVLMRPSRQVTAGNPLPVHMANGNALRVDVPRGTVVTREMVREPESSRLWALRADQDARWIDA